MEKQWADIFVKEWLDAWNSHDLDRILSHYTDDIEITTPMIKLATGGHKDSLSGKEAVKEYWTKALEKFPDLHFQKIAVTMGVNSVAVYYQSIMGKHAMEVMFFTSEGKVNRMYAHYD